MSWLRTPLKCNFHEVAIIKLIGDEKMEHCENPWKDTCNSENIKLYIMIKGEKRPICQQCWINIANKEVEW